jgi:iron complex outermembrane receptor protein
MGASIAVLAWSTQGYAMAAAPAAPADNSTALTEVVVTTRKTAEKLQDVPLAITAVKQNLLDEGHFEGLEDIANQVPGLKFTSFLDSFNGNVTIRGLQQDNVQNAVGNVGSFLDGIYLQRGYLVDTSIGDFDRIEVVKGPQSSLYGENTFAGAINFVLKQPTDEFHVDATGSVGNAGLAEEKFGASGPIIKGVLDFRAFVAQSDYDGTWRNNFPGATGDSKYLGGHTWKNYSGSLKFTPIKNLSITAEYYNLRREQQIAPYYTIDGDSALDHLNCGLPTASGGYSLWCGNLPTNVSAFRTGVGDPPPGLIAQPQPPTSTYTRMWKISANYKINNDFLLSYNYGNVYGSSLEQASFSTDAYNPDPSSFLGIAVQREGGLITYDSHEVRLSYTGDFPIKGEVGYFHSDADDHLIFGLLFVPSGVPYLSQTSNPTDLTFNGIGVPFDNLKTAYATDAPFGRLSYSFLQDKATISAEVRETTTSITTNDLLAGSATPLHASYSDITPRFTAQYKLTPDELLYLSAARGAKAGGFNGYVSGSLTLLPSQQAFGEETNWTYEAGWKASLLHRTLTIDADVFYINWTNKQQAVVPANYVNVVNSQATGVVPTIYENIGDAYSYGFEMTTQWRPIHHLALDWSLSLQNPRFAAGAVEASFIGNCDNVVCKANGGVAGNEIDLVSQFTTDFGASYNGTLSPTLDYDLGFNESYRGPEFADDTNTASLAGFWLTNIHGELIHDNVRISLWAKNLFNTVYLSSTFSVPSIYQYNANFGERRTFGLTASLKY